MGLLKKGRVNMVITNRVLRYSVQKKESIQSIVEKGEFELPPDIMKDGTILNKPLLIDLLSKLIKKQKWKGKTLYFALPDDTVVIRQLQVPSVLSKEEALGYLLSQLGHSFHLPFTNPAISVDFLDVVNNERNILLYAYPKEKIDAFVEVFEEVGLKPMVADLTSLSVYRYYFNKYRLDKANILHIQWNWDYLILTVFRNHKAIFTRNLKMNIREDDTALTENDVLNLVNEYRVEVNRIIDFYQYSISKGQAEIDMVLLSGDFPYLSTVTNILKDSLSIQLFTFSNDNDEIHYADVLGLALKPED
jgi:type IV pilus assembly protein PilM